jgi:uncharacterized protein (TIGR02646 family)
MRRIDPTRVAVPAILTDPNGLCARERKRAETHFGNAANAGKKFSFRVYGDPTVREALHLLFQGKCAYCDSVYAATQPLDVEHWRPKAQVEFEDGTSVPGYYWRASVWENLLPSCIDCNRQRGQVLADGTTGNHGKGNQFPLADESKRARNEAEIPNEDPLLLHPYYDDPDLALEVVDGGVMRARDHEGEPHRKGKASIRVYALNRSALVQERAAVRLLIVQRMYTVRVLAELIDRDEIAQNPDVSLIIEDLLSHEMGALAGFMDPARPFSHMARQMIVPFIRSLTQ